MRKYYLIFLIVIIFSSCKKDLSGHWHSKGLDNFEYVIDIEKNKNCQMISSLCWEPSKGIHIENKNHVTIFGSCGVYSFNYKIKNNTVFIQNNLNKKIILERKPNCNKIKDYKTELYIEFLKIKNRKTDSIYNFEEEFNEHINIGFSKTGKTPLIESSRLNGLHNINSLDSLMNKFEENHSKKVIPFINYILTPDKKIRIADLNKVLESINKNVSKNVYIRTLKNSFSNKELDIFEYTNIKSLKQELNYDSNKRLDEIIN